MDNCLLQTTFSFKKKGNRVELHSDFTTGFNHSLFFFLDIPERRPRPFFSHHDRQLFHGAPVPSIGVSRDAFRLVGQEVLNAFCREHCHHFEACPGLSPPCAVEGNQKEATQLEPPRFETYPCCMQCKPPSYCILHTRIVWERSG